MSNKKQIFLIFMISIISILSAEVLPMIDRFFHMEDMGYEYSRGTFLIVLADESLETILREESTGDFIQFKQTQGYDVDLVVFSEIGGTIDNLYAYLEYYSTNNSLLEYVLLIGDVNGSYSIPPHTISSYNENDLDVTDYPYTFFNNDPMESNFIIGRWPIRTQDDLKKIKKRSIQYVTMDFISDFSYLNNALLVAGNYSDGDTWPVTPVWTSKWLMDELYHFGYGEVDTAFFHLNFQQVDNPLISSTWNEGIGIINYRGWGDANGWHKPYFHKENIIEDLTNGWRLPVVMSFVCNTGDFGNDYGGAGLDKSFGELLITGGSINNPKGAAAMIGPSDLDTDTRFNNVLCAVLWDEMLEGRIPEIGPALHAGKQALKKEFKDLEVNGTNIVDFYHHVYSVIGDPSLPVWLGEPKKLNTNMDLDVSLTSSHISIIVTDEESGNPVMDVVGALIHDGQLIAKGLSNQMGELDIDFDVILDGSQLELFLNKAQYHQEKIILTYESDDNTSMEEHGYEIPSNNHDYLYTMVESDFNDDNYRWIELNPESEFNDRPGTNLELVDDTLTIRGFGFDFQYYGQPFDSLTICSNGWASFLPCLRQDGNFNCNEISYFYNNSITHPLGPYGMLAPFFDDLDDNMGEEPFNVYFWTNNQDSVIVEWHEVANGQTDENCPTCDKETFQLILDGKNTSLSGDGEIIFNYLEIHDIDDHGSTIGIESPDKNSGLEFLFNNVDAVDSLHDNMSIRFISNMSYIPGCTNSAAENYNPYADFDDESCILSNNTENMIPKNYILNSYPNPFNPSVKVSIIIPKMGWANIEVFDIRGRKLSNLANQNFHPGHYSLMWDATNYSSGVYFILFSNHEIHLKKKILLLK